MSTENRSTVYFRSNLQPIKANFLWNDREFLSHIHDVFALEQLKKDIDNRRICKYHLSAEQTDEYERAAVHCAYAEEGDYPWGTKRMEDGSTKLVCLCENIGCSYLRTCRPAITDEEIERIKLVQAEREKSCAENQPASIWEERLFPEEKKTPAADVCDTAEKTPAENPPEEIIEDSGKQEDTISDTEKEGSVHQDEADLLSGFINLIGTPAFDVLPQEMQEKIRALAVQAGSLSEQTDRNHKKSVGPDSATGDDSGLETVNNGFEIVEQEKIIEEAAKTDILVNAGPGTGKTHMLIQRVIHLLKEGYDPQTMVILCFSRNAVAVIRKRLLEAEKEGRISHGWNLIEVRTFDSFATRFICELCASNLKEELLGPDYDICRQNYLQRIETATETIRKRPSLLANVEFLMVDEVQDLIAHRADFVLSIIEALQETGAGIMLLGDSCQAIYDYQLRNLNADNGSAPMISSDEFYRKVEELLPDAKKYAVIRNYRQKESPLKGIGSYRAAIFEREIEDADQYLENILQNLPQEDERWSSCDYQGGTLGILTRTNGQALRISTELRKKNINHVLKWKDYAKTPGDWISRLLFSYDHENITRDIFKSAMSQLYPTLENADIEEYWNGLVGQMDGGDRQTYRIEDILSTLKRNEISSRALLSPDEKSPSIVVSTIHRAKGSEFGTVWLQDDLLVPKEAPDPSDGQNGPDEDSLLEEHRVRYVALTRPREALKLFRIKKDNRYVLSAQDGDSSRHYQQKGKRKKSLSHLEVGKEKDIEEISFALTEEMQTNIRKNIEPGDAVKLIKCREKERPEGDNQPPAVYRLEKEAEPGTVLGYTGWSFYQSLQAVMQKLYGTSKKVGVKYFPNELHEIYVTRLISCIKPVDRKLEGAKRFGDWYVWTGIQITALAHKNKRGEPYGGIVWGNCIDAQEVK